MPNDYLDESSNDPYGQGLNPDVYPGINQVVDSLDKVTNGVNGNLSRGVNTLQQRLEATKTYTTNYKGSLPGELCDPETGHLEGCPPGTTGKSIASGAPQCGAGIPWGQIDTCMNPGCKCTLYLGFPPGLAIPAEFSVTPVICYNPDGSAVYGFADLECSIANAKAVSLKQTYPSLMVACVNNNPECCGDAPPKGKCESNHLDVSCAGQNITIPPCPPGNRIRVNVQFKEQESIPKLGTFDYYDQGNEMWLYHWYFDSNIDAMGFIGSICCFNFDYICERIPIDDPGDDSKKCPIGTYWDGTKCRPIIDKPPPDKCCPEIVIPPCPPVTPKINVNVNVPPINVPPCKVEVTTPGTIVNKEIIVPAPIVNITNKIETPKVEKELTCEELCELIDDKDEKEDCLAKCKAGVYKNHLEWMTTPQGMEQLDAFVALFGIPTLASGETPFATAKAIGDNFHLASIGSPTKTWQY